MSESESGSSDDSDASAERNHEENRSSNGSAQNHLEEDGDGDPSHEFGWGEDEEDEEFIDEGPGLVTIPDDPSEKVHVLDPQEPLGLSLTTEAWVVNMRGQGEKAGIGRGVRVVRFEGRHEWSLVASLRELKVALRNSRGRGDNECKVVVSASLSGELKWNGAVVTSIWSEGAPGLIFGIPANARTVLCIDPSKQTATTFGNLPAADPVVGDVDDRWCGGVLTKGGKIIGIPFNATQFLEIDPEKRTVAPRGETIFGRNKYRGPRCVSTGAFTASRAMPLRCSALTPKTATGSPLGTSRPSVAPSGAAA